MASDRCDHTPIRCRPKDWEGSFKRSYGGQPGEASKIDLFVVITAYKESPAEIDASLLGVHHAIRDLSDERFRGAGQRAGPFGALAWERIAVCVVCDGRVRGEGADQVPIFIDSRQTSPKSARGAGAWSRPELFAEKYNLWNDEAVRNSLAVDGGGGDRVEMHLFEKLCDAAWMEAPARKDFFAEELRGTPMQMMLAVKELNTASKLDSHLWFLRAFAARLDPSYVFFVDAGTEPRPGAICNMLCALEQNEHCAGVCGEIAIARRTAPCDADVKDSSFYTNLVIAAQKFEYKAAHLLDKTLESTCGFIPVLPGAFSGYRFGAISTPSRGAVSHQGHGMADTRPSPLAKYFEELKLPLELGEGEEDDGAEYEFPEWSEMREADGTRKQAQHSDRNLLRYNGRQSSISEGVFRPSSSSSQRASLIHEGSLRLQERQMRQGAPGLSKANMYLAEDRILCYELLASANKRWTMKFVAGAVAFVDPVDSLMGLLGQRRRWLNGSLFATMHYLRNFWHDIRGTAHSRARKAALGAQWCYSVLTMMCTMTLLANFYLCLHFTVTMTFPNHIASSTLDWIYLGTFAMLIVTSLSDDMKGDSVRLNKVAFFSTMYIMGAASFGLFALSVFQVWRIGYKGKASALVSGFQKIECNVDKFNDKLIGGPAGFCAQLAPGSFAALQANFLDTCTDANDLWTLAERSPGAYSVVTAHALEGCQVKGAWKVLVAIAAVGCFWICGLLHAVVPRLSRGGLAGIELDWKLRSVATVTTTFLQYLFMLPTFINVIMVFSFCNLHDFSWGTKGLDQAQEHAEAKSKGGAARKKGCGERLCELVFGTELCKEPLTNMEKRTIGILLLLLINGAWVHACLSNVDGACFLTTLAFFVGFYNGAKVVTSVAFVLEPVFCFALRRCRVRCRQPKVPAARSSSDTAAAAAAAAAAARQSVVASTTLAGELGTMKVVKVVA
jgi:cellulose synthase/poly-beta-1,6-N-acetylglucosamine synthase-like glycosyltransferase